MHRWVWLLLSWVSIAAAEPFPLRYHVSPDAKFEHLEVSIELPEGRPIRQLSFNTRRHSMLRPHGDGEIRQSEDQLIWQPPRAGGKLTYLVEVDHQRRGGGFDARLTRDWLLMRADDLVPPARVRKRKGAEASAELVIELPEDWRQAYMAAPRRGNNRFTLAESGQALVRPKGWLAAGKLTSRVEQLGTTELILAAPAGQLFKPMETLVFLQFVWPSLEKALANIPDMMFITGAGDPFWRGGLSGPKSLYLHNDRPLVSENGTSTLLHELVHVITGIHGAPGADWIAEGLAEFYSVELLYRAGGLTRARRDKIFADLRERGEAASELAVKRSRGAVTARAAALFADLAAELEKCQAGGIDLLVQQLPEPSDVTLDQLRNGAKQVCQHPSKVLRGVERAGAEADSDR